MIAVAGWSMLPAPRDGDRLLVAHRAAGLRPGDVVVFRREGMLIAHRLLRTIGSGPGARLITRGDNTGGPIHPCVSTGSLASAWPSCAPAVGARWTRPPGAFSAG